MSKCFMKRTVIFGCVLFVIISAVVGFRHSPRYKPAALNSAELDLTRLKPRPPVDECSDVERMLRQLRGPRNAIDKRLKNRGTFTTDEIAVYHAVLKQWLAGDRDPLNVSIETYPLDVLSETPACECLTGIDPQSLLLASHSVHTLTSDVWSRKNVRLVDPDSQRTLVVQNDVGNSIASSRSIETVVNEKFRNGLFSVSEIAFNVEHSHAIVSYSFVCGSLCGSGRTLVLEKVGEQWKPAKLECGGWAS